MKLVRALDFKLIALLHKSYSNCYNEDMPAIVEVLSPKLYLPSSLELPSSDDFPVDNEDQNFIPNFLLFLLENIWTERQDWYFGVDMGVYYNRKTHSSHCS